MPELEYSKVHVRGQFDHENVVYIGPKSYISNEDSGGGLSGNAQSVGYYVITPFQVEDSGQKILVNRGWVSSQKYTPESRGEILSKETIDLTGCVRLTEIKSAFTAENKVETDKWRTRDVEALAQKLDTLPIFIDASLASTVPNGPRGGQTRVKLTNDHFSYMSQWFAATGITLFFWFSKFVW